MVHNNTFTKITPSKRIKNLAFYNKLLIKAENLSDYFLKTWNKNQRIHRLYSVMCLLSSRTEYDSIKINI